MLANELTNLSFTSYYSPVRHSSRAGLPVGYMFFEAVKGLYSEKKMFIPKSMDELEDAMNEVVKHGSDF